MLQNVEKSIDFVHYSYICIKREKNNNFRLKNGCLFSPRVIWLYTTFAVSVTEIGFLAKVVDFALLDKIRI